MEWDRTNQNAINDQLYTQEQEIQCHWDNKNQRNKFPPRRKVQFDCRNCLEYKASTDREKQFLDQDQMCQEDTVLSGRSCQDNRNLEDKYCP